MIDGLMRDQDTAIFKPFLARPSPSGGRPPRTIARCRDDGLCTPNTGDGRRKICLTSVASFCICLADGTARQPVDILFTGARVGGRRAGQCPATIRAAPSQACDADPPLGSPAVKVRQARAPRWCTPSPLVPRRLPPPPLRSFALFLPPCPSFRPTICRLVRRNTETHPRPTFPCRPARQPPEKLPGFPPGRLPSP